MKTTIKSVSFKAALVLAAGAALSLDVSPAIAGDAQADLSVTADISANCLITTTAVAFGAYDPVGANKASALNGAGKVTVTCTNGSAGTITLGQGANSDVGSSAAIPLRRMLANTADFLSYDLFTNPERTTVWSTGAGHQVVHNGDGTATDIDVYGKMPANQNKPIGAYTDTVVANVNF
jgi:spore coat protein U-like protein